MERDKHGLIDFLQTNIPKEELAIALKVLKAFKQCETNYEYIAVDFAAWVKIEQLEEYLEHLVDGTPLKEDTLKELARVDGKEQEEKQDGN